MGTTNYLTKGQAALKLFISVIVTMILGIIFSMVLDIEIPAKYSDVFSYLVYLVWPYSDGVLAVAPNINFALLTNIFEWTARAASYSIIAVMAFTAVYNLIYLSWSIKNGEPEYANGTFIKTVRTVYSACTYISAILLFTASYLFMMATIADMCEQRKVFLIWFLLLTAVFGGIMVARLVTRIGVLLAGGAENIGSYAVTLLLAALPLLLMFALILIFLIFAIRVWIFSR